MKPFLFTLILLVLSNLVYSQINIFHEDFELPSAGDSVTSNGMPIWTINTTLFSEGSRSYRDSVGASVDTAYLITNSFSTLGSSIVTLTFDHICKIEHFDKGELEVSVDNGSSWTKLISSQYQGSGQFAVLGNRFASTSYPTVWDPAYNLAVPTNAWWKSEVFNIGALVGNHANVKVRFKLSNDLGGIPGNNGAYGWLIDNIKVTIPGPPIDAALDSIISPQSIIPYGTSTVLKVVIKNMGTTALTSIPLFYSINHSGLVNETWNGNLLPGDTTIYTFSTIYTPPIGTNSFLLKTWVNLSGDMVHLNDTNYRTVNVALPLWDAGVMNIERPRLGDTICSFWPFQIQIWVKNFGSNTITSMNIQAQFGNFPAVNKPYSGNLINGDSVLINFMYPVTGMFGNYNFCVKTILSNDVDTLNNKLCNIHYATYCSAIENIWQTNFTLLQNTPNPAGGNTQIDFEIPISGKVKFQLTNMLGQILESEEKEFSSGRNSINLDVSKLPAGIYYYSIEMEGRRLVKKMVVE